MLVTSRDRIKKLFDEGKTEAEVLALDPLKDLNETWAAGIRHSHSRTRATSIIRSSGSRACPGAETGGLVPPSPRGRGRGEGNEIIDGPYPSPDPSRSASPDGDRAGGGPAASTRLSASVR